MLRFLSVNFRWIGGAFLLTYLSSFGQTFFIAASAGEWQRLFGLSDGEFGRLYMLATLASALTLPLLGRIVDILPEHRVVLYCAPVLALAMVMVAYAPGIIVLAIGIYLLRLFGQGMMTHIALTATGKWFAANRGRAISLVVLGHQGGEATLPALFAAITLAYGFQAGWSAGALFLIAIGLPLGVWAFAKPRRPQAEGPGAPPPPRSWTRAEVLRDPVFWMLLTGVLAPAFIGTTFFFHQNYMTTLRGWPPQLFPAGFTLMALTTIGFALLTGWLIDRFSARAILPFYLLPLALACFTSAGGSHAAFLFGFMFLLGVSYGFSSTLFGSLWPEVYGTANLGAVRSIVVAAMVIATATGPGLTGTLIDLGISLPRQMLVLGVYCLFAAGMMTVAARLLRRRLLLSGASATEGA